MRNAKTDIETLIAKYSLTEVIAWERVRELSTFDDEGFRDELRGSWTNASRVWVGGIGAGLSVVICEFSGSWPWYNVIVSEAVPVNTAWVKIEDQKREPLGYAITTDWNGERAGSGIPRIPESLRGFMYRVTTGGDHKILPEDVISYLVSRIQSNPNG